MLPAPVAGTVRPPCREWLPPPLPLRASGVVDFGPLLAGVAGAGVCNARQLEGIASSLEAAFRLKEVVNMTGSSSSSSGTQQHNGDRSRPQDQSPAQRSHEAGHQQRPAAESSSSSSSSSNGRSRGRSRRVQTAQTAAADSGSSPEANQQQQQQQQDQPRRGPMYPTLAALAAGIREEQRATLMELRRCIRWAPGEQEAHREPHRGGVGGPRWTQPGPGW
jgi:hypothetical protein